MILSRRNIIVGSIVLLFAALALVWAMRGGSSVDDYLAQLHAKGERLYFTDPPFPKMTNGTPRLDRLVNAADQIATMGGISYLEIVRPGEAEVAWAQPKIREEATTWTYPPRKSTNYMDWAQLVRTLDKDEKWLAEIRASLDEAEPDMGWQTNSLTYRRTFVQQRKAAHAMAAATLLALYQNDKPAALKNLLPLIRTAMLERNETTLVSQMVRVAECGVGLSVTWQALQAKGWSDEQLEQLQKSWEDVQILDALEKGFAGERLHGLAYIRLLREPGTNAIDWAFSGRSATVRDRLLTKLWHMTVADRDELFYVNTLQRQVEHGRLALKGAPLYQVEQLFEGDYKFITNELARSDSFFRHPFCSIAIPNFSRACQNCIHPVVQQRLTIAAIALTRYKLRHGKWPESLEKLVPEFLTEVPRDPMDLKSLRYRVNADETFTLYSIGDDGKDDGGNAHPAGIEQTTMFNGLDIVWPRAAPSISN